MPAPSGAQGSGTLTKQEKDAIRKSYGNMASPLFQTVAKLYVCAQTGTRWQDTNVWGAICVVVDRSIQPPAYLIQILDLQKFGVLFSHELYVGCAYNCNDPMFQCFEVDSGFVGFAFADNAEAKDFGLKVLAAVPKSDPNAVAQPASSSKLKSFLSKASMATGIQLPGVQQGVSIGVPTGFVHKQHIGYDPAKGFECSDIPEQWKAMFRSAGIKKSDMQNPEKAAVIYGALQAELGDDFLEKPLPDAPVVASKGSAKKAPPVPKRGASSVPEAPEAPEAPDAPPPPDAPGGPPEPPSGPVSSGPSKPTPRGGLLADIAAGGFQLKKVGEGEEKAGGLGPPGSRPKSASSAIAPAGGGIMGALAQAMENRFKAVQSEDGDGADDVDDWSD
jgi:Wiskott-Aldrich syndrome protein